MSVFGYCSIDFTGCSSVPHITLLYGMLSPESSTKRIIQVNQCFKWSIYQLHWWNRASFCWIDATVCWHHSTQRFDISLLFGFLDIGNMLGLSLAWLSEEKPLIYNCEAFFDDLCWFAHYCCLCLPVSISPESYPSWWFLFKV